MNSNRGSGRLHHWAITPFPFTRAPLSRFNKSGSTTFLLIYLTPTRGHLFVTLVRTFPPHFPGLFTSQVGLKRIIFCFSFSRNFLLKLFSHLYENYLENYENSNIFYFKIYNCWLFFNFFTKKAKLDRNRWNKGSIYVK